jgi:hypothetical protein
LPWIALVGTGFFLLLQFEATAGQDGQPPASWPLASGIKRTSDRPTLLVFAHPRCPCTSATVGELDLLMTRCQGKADVCVLFYKPSDAEPSWEQTDTWYAAARIPGVSVLADPCGAEAARFCAETSGHALLYSPDGRLLFTGGITAARGHAGNSQGRTALVALLTEGKSDTTVTPVFGCPLSSEATPRQ